MNFFTLIFKNSYSYNLFVKYVILISLFIIILVGIVNYIVDPLRMFQHENKFNAKQLDFDERQQKTNYLKFVAVPKNINFESVLLGSSRSTYINQNRFEDLGVFNYAANGMSIYEYDKFIEYFIKINRKAPKKIILGMDFFNTALEKNRLFNKENYLIQTESYLYRLKTLLNIKLTEYSIRNIKQFYKTSKPFYTRNNIKYIPNTPNYQPKNTIEIESNLIKFKNYKFDSNMKKEYIKLKTNYKNSDFIIYTSPVTLLQLKDYEKNNYLQHYFHWLEELVEIFGEVHHFMYPNYVTSNLNYFFDATHMLPQTGEYIARYISKKEKFKDFGITLTKDNIREFILNYPKYSQDYNIIE